MDEDTRKSIDIDKDGVIEDGEIDMFIAKTSTNRRIVWAGMALLSVLLLYIMFGDTDRVERLMGLFESIFFGVLTLVGAALGFTTLFKKG